MVTLLRAIAGVEEASSSSSSEPVEESCAPKKQPCANQPPKAAVTRLIEQILIQDARVHMA